MTSEDKALLAALKRERDPSRYDKGWFATPGAKKPSLAAPHILPDTVQWIEEKEA